MKIVGIGLANLDLIGVLPAFPDKNSKNRVDARGLVVVDGARSPFSFVLDGADVLVIDGRQPVAQLAAARRARAQGAAALKCRGLGGRAALPTAAELDAFLAARRA